MENIDKALGVDPKPSHTEETAISKSAEKTLKAFANTILVIGIVACVVMLLGGIAQISDSKPGAGLYLIALIIPVLAGALMQWAFITVICNISNNLREINRKIK